MQAIPFEIVEKLFHELPDVNTYEEDYIYKEFDLDGYHWATKFYVAKSDGKKIWICNAYAMIPFLIDGNHKIISPEDLLG
jgi:hypothetical protein